MIFTKEEVELAKSKNLKIWVVGTTKDSFKKDVRHFFQQTSINLSKYSDIYQKFITENYDIEGDNINHLSKLFNEFCAMYYVWKNNLKSEYVGFCHYRRQIPITILDFKELERGKIQYFSSFYNNRYPIAHRLPEILEKKYQHFYKWISAVCYAGDTNLYYDLEEYLDKQEILDKDSIKDYCDCTKFIIKPQIILRCSYVCKWEVFDKMMKFFNGYFEFLVLKHNLHSEEDWKTFYKENYINHYIKNWNKLIEEYGRSFMLGYSSRKYLQRSKDNAYWQKPLPYLWRLYSVLIEELFSMYFQISPSFYTTLLEETNQSCPGRVQDYLIFKYIKKHKFKNILLFNVVGKYTWYDLINIMNLYKAINKDANFKILKRKKEEKTFLEQNTYHYKHLIKLYNDNLIDFNDIDNYSFDFIYMSDTHNHFLKDKDVQDKIIKSLSDNTIFVIEQEEFNDKIKSSEYDNIIFNKLREKGYNISIVNSPMYGNRQILYFIKIKKRD